MTDPAAQHPVRAAQDFRTQGLVAKTDVLAVEVQLAERQQDLIRARNNVELAVAVLNHIRRSGRVGSAACVEYAKRLTSAPGWVLSDMSAVTRIVCGSG